MAFKFIDRVQYMIAVAGTGNFVFGGASAVPGFQKFSAGLADGDTTAYFAFDPTGLVWEVGVGTYVASGDQLARTFVTASSSGGALVNFPGNVTQIADNNSAYIMSVLYPVKQAYTYGTVQLGSVSSNFTATFTLDQDIATHVTQATFTNGGAGSINAEVKIGTVDVGGLGAVVVNSSSSIVANGTNNAAVAGATITAVFTGVSGTLGAGAAFTLSGTVDVPAP